MSDLLKEAIADAKAVRETALANAKMALEEAFTPHLKSMLSAKLAEDDLEEEDPFAKDDDEEEEGEEDAESMARQYREDDDEESAVDIDIDADGDDDEEAPEQEEEGVSEEDIIEVSTAQMRLLGNGKYVSPGRMAALYRQRVSDLV